MHSIRNSNQSAISVQLIVFQGKPQLCHLCHLCHNRITSVSEYNLSINNSLTQQMQTPAKASYYQYSKQNLSPNQQLPLRSKPFVQIDNLANNNNYEHSPAQDQVSEIKKKYEYIFTKSNGKQNDQRENGIPPAEGRPSSSYNALDSCKRSQTPKVPYEYVPRQRKLNDFTAEIGEIGLKRESKRDYTAGKNQENRSQLESNRTALSMMRSELQSKLNDLNARTSNQNANGKGNVRQPPKINQDQSLTYEAILGKYSKPYAASDSKRQTYGYVPSEQTSAVLAKSTPRDKKPEAMTTAYISKIAEQRRMKLQRDAKNKEQLSIISEISNSNNSEGHKEVIDFEEKRGGKKKIEMSHIEPISQPDDNPGKITESTVCLGEREDERRWFKNTTSYLEEGRSAKKSEKREEGKREYRLEKLETAEGLNIKRTTTEQSFMNFHKLTALQPQQKQEKPRRQSFQATPPKQVSYKEQRKKQDNRQIREARQVREVKQTKEVKSNYKYSFVPPEDIDYKQTTFGKVLRNNLLNDEPQLKRSCTPSHTPAHNEIEKLKEKYKIGAAVKPSTPIKTMDKPSSTTYEPTSRNNEAISKQIEKLDRKIKEIEQSKKELNINFAPLSSMDQLSKDRSKSALNTPVRNVSATLQKDKTDVKAKYPPSERNRPTPGGYLDRIKPMYSEITLPQPASASGFALKLIPVEITNDQDAYPSNLYNKNMSREYKNKLQIQARTDCGMEQRKRKLQQKTEVSNNIKQLVKMFGQQAVMDEGLRNNKIWFATEPESKWETLHHQLQLQGVNLTQSQLKQEFQVIEAENNPFFSVTDSKCTMKSLVQSYLQAQNHWEDKILHCFSRQALEEEGFSANKVDFDRKGCIKVEDLVRFLNIESGTFLRNRDVSLIFRRLQPKGDSLVFEGLFDAVAT